MTQATPSSDAAPAVLADKQRSAGTAGLAAAPSLSLARMAGYAVLGALGLAMGAGLGIVVAFATRLYELILC